MGADKKYRKLDDGWEGKKEAEKDEDTENAKKKK